MLGLAISITAKAFEKKKDRGGKSYILHCLKVMYDVAHLGVDAMCAAVMHDLVEDTDETSPVNYTPHMLVELGFSNDVATWVDLLTHKPNEEYDHYVKRISFSEVASKIKMADLEHNSDVTRLKGLTKKDFDRIEKYFRSHHYLSKR